VPSEGVDDFSFMSSWTTDAYVSDARAALELMRREHSGVPLFIAGFSRGVTLAYATALTEPHGVLHGLIALDGFFKKAANGAPVDVDTARRALATSGAWASDVAAGIGWERRAALMSAASANPAASALTDLVRPDSEAPRNVGDQLAQILYRAWRPGGLANPIDGFSKPQVLATLLAGYDRYYPAIQTPEGSAIAAVADAPHTELDDRWGALDLPILYFGATGMGAEWLLDGISSAADAGPGSEEIHVLEGYGHLDVLAGERSQEEVFTPLLRWLERQLH
jgi:hypothetical protein